MKCIDIGIIATLGLLVTCFAGAQEGKVNNGAQEGKINNGIFFVDFDQPNRMSEDVEIFRRILNHKLDLPRVTTFPTLANPNLLSQPGSGLLGISGGGLQGGLGQYGGIGGNVGLNGGMGAIGSMGATTLGGGAFGLAGGQGFGGGIAGNTTTSGSGLNPILTSSRSSVDYPAAEGVYLKGYGVIYNFVLPPQPKPQAKESRPPAKPVSDWDRISKEMRGEKVTSENKPSQPKEPTLTENLIKLLAENGHHFGKLGEKENITIVITFREPNPAIQKSLISMTVDYPFPYRLTDLAGSFSNTIEYGIGVNSDKGLSGSISNNGNGLPGNLGSGSQGASGSGSTSGLQEKSVSTNNQPGSETGNLGGGKGTGSSLGPKSSGTDQAGGGSEQPLSGVKDILLLADLHFKQNKLAEAEALYRKAFEAVSSAKDSAQRADILRKLAQIFVANGKYDEAKIALELILEKKGKEATKPMPKETPKPLPLPAKLIITAPKALLDQVGANKIDFEAFSKAVKVEYENAGTIGVNQK